MKDVLRLILGQAARLALSGLAVGTIVALALARFLESQLFNVTSTDAFSFAFSAIGVLAIALVTCLGPARRATQVDPMVALRAE